MTREEINYHNRLWYKKTYEALIDKGLNRVLEDNIYTEKHHILPKCMGGKDEENNYVTFTAREHIIAHMLLSCMYPDNIKLLRAAAMMSTKEGIRLSLRLSSYFREKYGIFQKGKILGKDVRIKMSNSRKGKKLSEDTKNKISISEKGKLVSENTRKKLSDNYIDSVDRRSKLSMIAKDRMKSKELREKISNSVKKNVSKNNIKKVLDKNSGKTFDSITELSNILGISRALTKKLILANPNRYIIISKSHPHIQGPDNTIYNSLNECSKATGHSKKTINRWIKEFPEKGFKYV